MEHPNDDLGRLMVNMSCLHFATYVCVVAAVDVDKTQGSF